ncbi:4Fe-4S dicluster domain-containing protein [Treponema putidum]|uniref:4Fe-4S dicluster domain-containing protein n=1 Tax=Treponema putidum TaxID=221027 RepID=UPI003D89FE65
MFKIAIPFVTYGGAHSFISLEEIGRALKKKKYVPVLGIKLASFHTLSKFFHTKILENKPGSTEERLIEAAVSNIFDLCSHTKCIKDNSASFAYTKGPMRFILKILLQEKIHSKFKTVSIIHKNCSVCKKCISVCPVNNFIFADGKVSIKNQKSCILCGECFYNCSCNAIDFAYRMAAQKRLNNGNIVLEKDLSAVYPKQYG